MVKPLKWKIGNFTTSRCGWWIRCLYRKHFFYPRESIRKQISQITTRNTKIKNIAFLV